MALHRSCMRDRIRGALVERIINGEYPPGTRLKELALAREFNVSQAPVREALRELEAVGLVESERYRGTRVRGIDRAELAQAYELRELIETAAALRAVPCRAEDLAALEQLVAGMERAFAAGETVELCLHGMRFHRRIVEMSDNAMFLRAWDSLTWDVRARIVALVVGQDLRQAIVDKRAVCAALRAGDGEAAANGLRAIVRGMIARLGETPDAA